MNEPICFFCGNHATPDQPLGLDEAGFLSHARQEWAEGNYCRSVLSGMVPTPTLRAPIDACQHCAQPATPTAPLVRSSNGRLYHEWPEDDDDFDLCPPLPQGFGRCAWCAGARPFGELSIVKSNGPYTRLIPLWPDGPVRDRDEVAAVLGLDHNDGIGYPDLMCDACTTKPPGPTIEARIIRVLSGRSSVSRPPKPTADQARAASVPVDGPGLNKAELMSLWHLGERQTRDLADRLVKTSTLLIEESPNAHGGSPMKRYRRLAR